MDRITVKDKCRVCSDKEVAINREHRGRMYYRSLCNNCGLILYRLRKKYKSLPSGVSLIVCSVCLWEGICDIHHIDEDHNGNSPDNLQVLCPNCHRSIHFPLTEYIIQIVNEELQ